LRLSGLQAGPLSAAFVNVSRRGFALPLTGTIHRSTISFFSSYAGSVTGATAHFPSGETAGAPTRSMRNIASWVSACFGAAAGSAATARNRNRPMAFME